MAKNELILTKENVNALCNKELKQYKESLVVADVDVEEVNEEADDETEDMMNEPTSTDEETVQFTYGVYDNEFTVKEISLETYNKIMELLK